MTAPLQHVPLKNTNNNRGGRPFPFKGAVLVARRIGVRRFWSRAGDGQCSRLRRQYFLSGWTYEENSMEEKHQ